MTRISPINKGIEVLEGKTNFLSGIFFRWLKDLRDYTNDGIYVPTITNTVGIQTITPFESFWVKTGNIITVSGRIDIKLTSGGFQTPSFDMSLPEVSSLTGSENLSGRLNLYIYDGEMAARMGNGVAEFAGSVFENGAGSESYFSYAYRIK